MSDKKMSPEELAKEHGRINGPGASYSYLAGYHSRDAEIAALREGLRKAVLWAECLLHRVPGDDTAINFKYLNEARALLSPSQPTTEKGEG